MTQEAETVAMELNIVSCQTCDALFIESERRQTCPYCGGPPVGPYFRFTLDGDGLHPKEKAWVPLINREEAVQQLKDLGYPEEEAEARVAKWEQPAPAAAEAPAAEAPAEEEEPMMIGPVEDKVPIAGAMFGGFLAGEDVDVGNMKDWLVELGAEREAAATAVGRLVAVRELINELAEAGVKAQVEVTAEETPAEAPSPVEEPAEGESPAAPEPETAGGDQESEPSEST